MQAAGVVEEEEAQPQGPNTTGTMSIRLCGLPTTLSQGLAQLQCGWSVQVVRGFAVSFYTAPYTNEADHLADGTRPLITCTQLIPVSCGLLDCLCLSILQHQQQQQPY